MSVFTDLLATLRSRKKTISTTVKPTSTNNVTWVSDLTTRFNAATEQTALVAENLKTQVENATQTVNNFDLNLGNLNLPSDTQVTLQVQNLTIEEGGQSVPVKPTEIWDDSTVGVNFYLDTVNGNDLNNGLTTLTAVKTLSKAIAVIKAKQVTDNWNTYLSIKGTLVAPFDLTEIFGTSPWAALTLQGWAGVPWTLSNVTPDAVIKFGEVQFDIYDAIMDAREALTFEAEKDIFFNNITFDVYKEMKFKGNIRLGSCSLKSRATSKDRFVQFLEGKYSIYNLTCDYTVKTPAWFDASILFAPAIVSKELSRIILAGDYTTIGYTSNPSGFFLLEVGTGSFLEYFASVPVAESSSKEIFVSGELVADPYYLLDGKTRFNSSRAKNFSFISNTDSDEISYFNFPTMANGRYSLGFSPKTGFLIEWRITAKSGTGTFRMSTGVGYPWGDALTRTFNNYDGAYTVGMGLKAQNANGLNYFLDVSSASGLTDIVVQLRHRKIN